MSDYMIKYLPYTFQIALIVVKLFFVRLEDVSWWMIFIPSYIMIIWEYIKMFSTKEKRIKLPVKTELTDRWNKIVDKVLEQNGVYTEVDTILIFNRNPVDGPLLLEYSGDIEKIKTLAGNEYLLDHICDKREKWYQKYLIPSMFAPPSTITWLLWDKIGNIIGIIAVWNFGDDNLLESEYLPLTVSVEIISNIKPSKDPEQRFENPYKFVNNLPIIECHEKINSKWVLTGEFDSELFTQSLIKPTKDTLSHLMVLFFRSKSIEWINKQYLDYIGTV